MLSDNWAVAAETGVIGASRLKKNPALQTTSFIVCSHFHWRLTNTFVLHYIHAVEISSSSTLCVYIHVGLTNGQTINIIKDCARSVTSPLEYPSKPFRMDHPTIALN